MSSWHSLQGYLGYRPSGALGRLKAKKRLWFVFDERNCQLLFYKSEVDGSTKDPQGCIDLRTAAISLNMDDPNQFIIHSHGKEHILTAETHESTMIWLLALQAKRDAINNSLTLVVDQGTVEFKEKEELKRKESLPSDVEIRQMIRTAMCAENGGVGESTERPAVRGGSSSSGSFFGGLFRSQSVREHRNYGGPVPESPLFNQLRKNMLHQRHQKAFMGSRQSVDLGRIEAGNLMRLNHTFVDRNRHCSGGSVATTDSDDTDTSIGMSMLNPAYWALEDDHSGSLPSLTEPLDSCCVLNLGGSPFDNNRDVIPTTSNSPTNCHWVTRGMDEISKNSSDYVKEIHDDLMSSKLELAKALDREALLKGVLDNKDVMIQNLEVQLKKTQEKCQGTEDLSSSSQSNVATSHRLEEKCRILQNQNRFLNEEVLKLSRMWQQEQMRFVKQNQKICNLNFELDKMKRDYVFLLQSSIRISGGDGPEFFEVPIYGGSRHKERVRKLLDEARKINPSLPYFEGMAKSGCHVDAYGFKHCYINEGLLLHYLCSQLNHHYAGQLSSCEQNNMRWKDILKQETDALPRTKEVKRLIRCGIPNHLRAKVWGMLINEKVKDIKDDKGRPYYIELCNALSESEAVAHHRKQIALDLFRTMPCNVHFNENEGDGVKKLQEVLQAFCLHNPSVGYCQGMNFIVGMALLFMKPEDAFWFLVAITERYFPPYYFDQNLMGAQADQDVLKDILNTKIPGLSQHLATLDVELSTITLNWFLAVFFESVPFDVSPNTLYLWEFLIYICIDMLFKMHNFTRDSNKGIIVQHLSLFSYLSPFEFETQLC